MVYDLLYFKYMTKQEIIDKYGLEYYEQCKAKSYARMKERYQNDPEYRKCVNNQSLTYKNTRYHNDSEFRKSENIRNVVRRNKRYHNDPEFRKSQKTRSNAYCKERYVKDGRIGLIENYELALADNFKAWEIHHRLELHPDNTVRFTRQSLIKLNLYYNRPSSELIWLRKSEHRQMHRKGMLRT